MGCLWYGSLKTQRQDGVGRNWQLKGPEPWVVGTQKGWRGSSNQSLSHRRKLGTLLTQGLLPVSLRGRPGRARGTLLPPGPCIILSSSCPQSLGLVGRWPGHNAPAPGGTGLPSACLPPGPLGYSRARLSFSVCHRSFPAAMTAVSLLVLKGRPPLRISPSTSEKAPLPVPLQNFPPLLSTNSGVTVFISK